MPSLTRLPVPLLPQVLDSAAVLPYFAAVITAVLGFFAARFTATAPLQASLNDAFRSLMDEWQVERAAHIARISELEGEVRRLRGTVNQGLQREESLQRAMDRLRVDGRE